MSCKNALAAMLDVHFERGVVSIPVLSPNHYWRIVSTKFGPLMQAIQTLKDTRKVESLKKDVLQAIAPPAIAPYTNDNMLRLDYFVTVAIKEERQQMISLSALAYVECVKLTPQ
jgi:hypothetical protein